MKLRYLFAALCLCLLLASPAAAAGGSGTAADPYIITTAAELQSIQNNLAAYYELGNDIDLSGVTWTPIGSSYAAPFSGQLDGNEYTIKNLDISSPSKAEQGLFGVVTSGAVIKNLCINNFNIISSHMSGCLIGVIFKSSSNDVLLTNIDIIQCSLSQPTATSHGCGLCCGDVDSASAIISECTIDSCVVTSSNFGTGGVVGRKYGSGTLKITNTDVTNTKIFSTNYYTAGICGFTTSNGISLISDCTVSDCIIKSIDNFGTAGIHAFCTVGGSVTANNCIVTNCIIESSTNHAGGIYARISTESSGDATNCVVSECSIIAGVKNAAGICGSASSSATIIIDSCAVTDNTILSQTTASGIYQIES